MSRLLRRLRGRLPVSRSAPSGVRRHRARTLLTLAALGAAGCTGWPAYQHRDDPPEGLTPAPENPRDLVTVDWGMRSEDVDATLPPTSQITLQPYEGVVVTGELAGVGWNDLAPSRRVRSTTCPGQDVSLLLSQPGDWLEDVDAIGVALPSDSQLCVEVTLPDAAVVGWDLLVFAADGCGLPSPEPVLATGEGLGGEHGLVTGALPAGAYLIALGGYAPNVPELTLSYTLAVSAMPGDGAVPCPLPPESTP